MSWLNPVAGVAAKMLQGEPDLPAFQRLDMQQEQDKAIAGNTAQLPKLLDQAGKINKFTRDEITQMLNAVIPGFQSITGQAALNIEDELRGQLPSDVASQRWNRSSAQAMGLGVGGGGMNRNLVARDLGLTSLDLMQTGMSSAQSWLSTMDRLYAPGMVDVGRFTQSFMVTPEKQASFDVEERNAQFQHDWAQNLLDWQGSTSYIIGSEMEKDDQAVADMVSSMVGKVGGAAMGKMI